MQERRLQIKTPHKSLFLTGLSGTEGRDFVARLISRLCRSKKSTCGQVYTWLIVGSKELLISVVIKINKKAPVKL